MEEICLVVKLVRTSVPVSAKLSMGMSAIIRAHSVNLFVGFE